MRFAYRRVETISDAVQARASADPTTTAFIAGGTNLIDLMKLAVVQLAQLVDITRLPLHAIEDQPDGGLRLGALATNAATAHDHRVASRYPVLAEAILAGASAQLRNVATNGGNLLQRTRCVYFTDPASPCNKRRPGSGCGAIGGVNRLHAILGASDQCIATHPSDMCVALAALEAIVQVAGPDGTRSVAFADLHCSPGTTPNIETSLRPGEIITAIDLPGSATRFARHSTYLKTRDRTSYAFALVSVAAALELEPDHSTIRAARIALGGVAHKPWRSPAAEAALVGRPASSDNFATAADILLSGAQPRDQNAFKIPLAHRAIRHALGRITR